MFEVTEQKKCTHRHIIQGGPSKTLHVHLNIVEQAEHSAGEYDLVEILTNPPGSLVIFNNVL